MTKASGPVRIEQYKPRLYEKHYTLCRFICPNCYVRYGEPDPHGYIDVEACDACKTLKAKRKDS